MQAVPFSLESKPPRVDLRPAEPGKAATASVVVSRSDGAEISHFLLAPPDDAAAAGVACYMRRQDAHHCRVDVVWQPPDDDTPVPDSMACEVSADGAVYRLPIRLDRRAATRISTAWLRPALIGTAGVALFAVVAMAVRNPAPSPVASDRPLVMESVERPPAATLEPLSPPESVGDLPPAVVADGSHEIREVRPWQQVAFLRTEAAVEGDRVEQWVLNISGADMEPGQRLPEAAVQDRQLPVAAVFADTSLTVQGDQVPVRAGAEQRQETRTRTVTVPVAMGRGDQIRRQRLERVLAFFRSEASRASESDGALRRADVLRNFRQTFNADAPFQGDLLVWNQRLAVLSERYGSATRSRFTEADLRALAWEALAQYERVRPPQPTTREEVDTVVVAVPLTDALVLVAPSGSSEEVILRPVGAGDSGSFHSADLSSPLRMDGREYRRILSPTPFQFAEEPAVPRFVVRTSGTRRLADGEVPAAKGGTQVLLLPGVRETVAVVEQSPAAAESAPEPS